MSSNDQGKVEGQSMNKSGFDRRTFLKMGGLLVAVTAAVPAGAQIFAPEGLAANGARGSAEGTSDPKWTMVVDLEKCDGCKICEEACQDENNLPRYEGKQARYDPYWIRIAEMKQEISGVETDERPIPLLCVMCDKPPCTHVCPTKASFVRDDGLVLIDEHRCIGCRYCIIACPYRVRYMVFKDTPDDQWTNHQVPKLMRGVASKCTFCVHRLDDGEIPRCVEECPNDVLIFGDRNDPDSKVAELLEPGTAQVLRANLEVGANIFYLDL